MTEIQRAQETAPTPERGLSLHPSVKAALLLFMTTLAGCMQKTEITPTQAPAAEVSYGDKSSPADYQSDKGDKYGECMTTKPLYAVPHDMSAKPSHSEYSGYDKRYPTCEQV